MDYNKVAEKIINKANKISVFQQKNNSSNLRRLIQDKAITSYDDFIDFLDTFVKLSCDRHAHFRNAVNFEVITNKNLLFHQNQVEPISSSYKIYNESIGYMLIPSVHPQNASVSAKTIRHNLDSIAKLGITKFVIDLRFNDGGDICAMLTGLGSILPNGKLALIKNCNSRKISCAKMDNQNCVYFNCKPVKLPRTKAIKNSKIAVLIGPKTQSSGELLAISLKALKNIQFFGSRTMGKTTNTCFERIDDSLIMLISTGFFCDYKGNYYKNGVYPDEELDCNFSIFDDNATFKAVFDFFK